MPSPRTGKRRDDRRRVAGGPPRGRWVSGIVAVLVLAAIVALLRVIAGPAGEAELLASAQAEGAPPGGSFLPGATSAGGAGLGVTGPGPMVSPAAEARAAQELEAAQRAAQEAAVRAAGTSPGAPATGPANSAGRATPVWPPGARPGTVLSRPDYVSEVEWQVLQGIAARSADPARELQRLVDKLRFSKQLDAWRASTDATQQQVLATQLLQDLPARVQAGDYARADALALQKELIATLEPDAAARAAREAAEAARLGGRVLQEQRR